MAWLAVERDGTEIISDGRPERVEKWGRWVYEESFEGEYGQTQIDLPDGAIYKLTRKRLTWDDDPVEI